MNRVHVLLLSLCARSWIAGLALFAVACSIGSATAATKSWIDPIGSFWSWDENWSPNGAPQPGDDVRIGNSPLAEDVTVYVDEDVNIASLEVTDGMTIFTEGYDFFVNGDVLVSGHNGYQPSLILVERGPNLWDFQANEILVSDGGALGIRDGGIVLVHEGLEIGADSALRGNGVVNLLVDGTRSMVLDGVINPRKNGMVINQNSVGTIDLDGDTGAGRLALFTSEGTSSHNLTINGTALYDDFGGSIEVAGGGYLQMNIVAGWVASVGASIEMSGPVEAGNTNITEIRGSELTLHGQLTAFDAADARIMAPTIIEANSGVSVESDSLLRFYGASVIHGGTFSITDDSDVHFLGATTVSGGTFHTPSNLSTDGAVRFSGPTTWNGDVTVNGIALQFGDATVSGITVVDADVLDMDGGGNTVWNVNHNATINTQSVDSSIVNTFDGTLNVAGGFVGKLTINLTGVFDEWTMAGEMNLAGSNLAAFPLERVAGSPLRVTGDVNVQYRVRIAADTTFANGSTITFENDSNQLQMSGETLVSAGAAFAGGGTLANGPSGEMTLADGASLGGTSLINRGLLQVGNSPGTATVEEFESLSDGTWLVEIGGHLPGTQHDRLLAGSGAQLGGLVEVALIDAGNGLFLPEIGDTFTILTSPGGVSGSFLNAPVSSAAGKQFHWSVLYNPNDVVLQLVQITVPEPNALTLAALGLVILRRRLRNTRHGGLSVGNCRHPRREYSSSE